MLWFVDLPQETSAIVLPPLLSTTDPYFSRKNTQVLKLPGVIIPVMPKRKRLNEKDLSKRYDRAAWIAEALNVLSQQGSAKLTVRNISDRLGVTTGSFYWHFKNRDDFVNAILEYWQLVFTDAVANEIGSISDEPHLQLYKLMEILTEQEIPRFNIAVRAWAAMDEKVAKVVRSTDTTQLEFVGHLFRRIGFEGVELEMRTRTFVVFMSAELGWSYDLSKQERLEAMKLRYEWFISR